MTEEEARKTICPKYKAGVLANPSCEYYPADLNKLDDIKCDGSVCMMWRWSQYEGDHLNVITSTTHGYCGLGGKS